MTSTLHMVQMTIFQSFSELVKIRLLADLLTDQSFKILLQILKGYNLLCQRLRGKSH